MIPVSTPNIDDEEISAVTECLKANWVSGEGPWVKSFENAMCEYVGAKHGVAVCNGTAALDLAMATLKIGPGDEVITPSFAIISCTAAIVRAGATPILVDCEPDTWNVSKDQILKSITPKTKAILLVHTYGLPIDLRDIASEAKKRGIFIIEDCAEAIGACYEDQRCGSFGDLSVFSFYANKHVTTGEGGMILTSCEDLATRARSLRNLSFGQGAERFVHQELGWNMRLSNVLASIGLAQIKKLPQTLEKKRALGQKYQALLKTQSSLQLPLDKTSYATNAYWVFGVVLRDSVKKNTAEVTSKLYEMGIETRPFFFGMHEQPVFKKLGLFNNQRFPNTELISRRGFYIPCGLTLSEADQNYVVECLLKVIET